MIKINNDKKEKDYSFQASIDTPSTWNYGGKDEQEAIEELKREVEQIITYYQNIDYSKIEYVDCFGNKIEKK